MKKKIAFLLALALLGTAAVVGCTKETKQPDDNTVTPDTTPVEAPEIPGVETTEYDNITVMKVGNREYTAALFRAIFSQCADYIGTNSIELLEKTAIDQIKQWEAIYPLSEDFGVALDDSDYQYIAQVRDEQIAQYEDGIEGYMSDLEAYHMTDAVYVENITNTVLFYKFAEVFRDGFSCSDEEILDYVNENYVRVKHILIKTEGLDDSQKAEARSRADRVLERARSGESFEELVKEISEDGMDVDTGYYFTYGTMVQEFEDASYALEVGEISDIVESQFGYHIIKKYPMEQDYILSDEEIVSVAEGNFYTIKYDELVAEKVANMEVVYYDTYEDIKAEVFAELTANAPVEEPAVSEETEKVADDAVAA